MKKTRNCAIIARRGGWEIRGGEREGELDVKFNTYGRGFTFSFHLQTGNVVEELLEFK